jgi:hypothetical protein
MRIGIVVGVFCLLAAWSAARAEDAASPQDLGTTIEALKQRNRDLERRLANLESKVGESPEGIATQQDAIRSVVEQMIAQKKFATSEPTWLENMKFAGDLRLRYDIRQLDENHTAGTLDNTKIFRFRVRFGMTKTWPDDGLEVGFRLATGADNDPTSLNQTFGDKNFAGSTTNASAFEEYPNFGIDRAYAKWSPKQLKGFTIVAGKMENPWLTSSTMWDGNVSPEGVWAEYRMPTNCPVEPFAGGGWFQIYTSNTKRNADLEAYDAGLRWAVTPDIKYTSAVTYYKFTNLDVAFAAYPSGGINPLSNTGVKAGQYPILDFMNKVDFKAFNMPASAFIDWTHNTDNQSHNGLNSAIAVGAKLGDARKKGDWDVRYVYKFIERDAVLGYFADADFGYPSRTARKGSEVGVDYAITDAMTAGLTVYYDTPIAGTTAANDVKALHIMADLVWRF